MPIRTNMKSLTPRREAYKREITLLSGGYSDKTHWPGGKITVYPWDNEIDEWMLENARKLSKEELIFNLLERCCNLNGGKVDDFVADEIYLILLVSRARLSHDKINYTSMCPFCGKRSEESAVIPNELEPLGKKAADYPGFDEIQLPESKDKLKIRPLLVLDERLIVGRNEEERGLVSDGLLRTLMRVVEINETRPDNLGELVNYYRCLPPSDANYLQKQGQKLTPHLNTAIPHKCDDCGRGFNHSLDFNQDFFR